MQRTTRSRLAKLLAILVISAGLTAAQSQDSREAAKKAGMADAATTVIGIAAGAAELNPLGPIVSMGLKPLMFRYAETRPELERPGIFAAASAMWSGAAANNLCVAAAILSGGTFAPACVAVGVAWGWKKWKDTKNERIFWAEGCPTMRALAEDPQLVCIYVPPVPMPQPQPVETVIVREIVSEPAVQVQ